MWAILRFVGLPSPVGILKVNFDAGFRVNRRTATAGVVIRDENGGILGSTCTLSYHTLSVFAAETKAVIHGLRFAKDLGFLSIVLEGDSRTVINKLNSHEQDFSDISALIWSAKELSKEFHTCIF